MSLEIGACNREHRKDAPELIRDYIDDQPRAKRKSCVCLLSELSKKHGYLAAVGAFEMTEEMLKQFKRMNQKGRVKQTASIRLSEKAQKYSKSYGKGYTSFFSRLIDAALDDAALVKKCL